MAHSKTTPLQILSQVGAGAGLFGVFYYSLFKQSPKKLAVSELRVETEIAHPSPVTEKTQVLDALELEKSKTSAYYWNKGSD
jgi:hypothetical protein